MSSAGTKRRSASLLDLPLELRNDIYRHTYGPYKVITYERQPSFACKLQLVPEKSPYLNLRLTCKQCLEEINQLQHIPPIVLDLTGLNMWPFDDFDMRPELFPRVKELHVAFRNPPYDILTRPSINRISSTDEEPFSQKSGTCRGSQSQHTQNTCWRCSTTWSAT